MVINGDCLEYLGKMQNCSVDLIVTDPPYKMTARSGYINTGGMFKKPIVKSGKVFAHNSLRPSEYAPLFYKVLKDGTHCYVMTNNLNLIEMLNSFKNAGFKFIKSLIWNKGNKVMGHYYMGQYEYILMFRKGRARMINHRGTSDILSVPNKKTKLNGKNLHDTEKPVELMRILIENSTNEGELVLDPFMGIGTTGIACVALDREFIGIELDEGYFNMAKDRINVISR